MRPHYDPYGPPYYPPPWWNSERPRSKPKNSFTTFIKDMERWEQYQEMKDKKRKEAEDKKKKDAPPPVTLGSVAQWWATTAVYGLPVGLITLLLLNKFTELAHTALVQSLAK